MNQILNTATIKTKFSIKIIQPQYKHHHKHHKPTQKYKIPISKSTNNFKKSNAKPERYTHIDIELPHEAGKVAVLEILGEHHNRELGHVLDHKAVIALTPRDYRVRFFVVDHLVTFFQKRSHRCFGGARPFSGLLLLLGFSHHGRTILGFWELGFGVLGKTQKRKRREELNGQNQRDI